MTPSNWHIFCWNFIISIVISMPIDNVSYSIFSSPFYVISIWAKHIIVFIASSVPVFCCWNSSWLFAVRFNFFALLLIHHLPPISFSLPLMIIHLQEIAILITQMRWVNWKVIFSIWCLLNQKIAFSLNHYRRFHFVK